MVAPPALKGTNNYYFVRDSYELAMARFEEDKRINGVALEGGSRSGKTWAVCMFICWYVCKNEGKQITIARDTFNALKKTTYKTLQKVWKAYGLPMHHFNKSATPIHYNDNVITFIGINDNIANAHGMEQDLLYINEGIFVMEDSFDQMEQRTTEFFILDYNPSEDESWIYNVADKRKDVTHLKTTFLDNPYAPKMHIRKILSYEPWHPEDRDKPEEARRPHPDNIESGTADKYKWEVYGLCIRSAGEDRIYRHFELIETMPDKSQYDLRVIGLDFGYSNDPTAVVEVLVSFKRKCIYSRELIYETGLSNTQIASLLKENGVGRNVYVVCDTSEGGEKAIVSLRRKGINAVGAEKGAGSVKIGIDKMKEFKHFVHVESVNLQYEKRNYKWKIDKATNRRLNVPIKKDDHLLDGERYAVTKFAA